MFEVKQLKPLISYKYFIWIEIAFDSSFSKKTENIIIKTGLFIKSCNGQINNGSEIKWNITI